MRVEKTGEQALSTHPEPGGSSPGSEEDDADPASPKGRAVTERGWVVEPSPPPVFSITPGAPGSNVAPGSNAAPDVPIASLRQLKAVLDRKDRARDGAERGASAPAIPPVAEVSNDLAATSGLIERAAPRTDEPRPRAVTPARVVVDAGWTDAARPDGSSKGPKIPGPRSAASAPTPPPPIPIGPPLRSVAAARASAAFAVPKTLAPVAAAPARPPATPPAARATGPTRVVPPVRPIDGAGGFPRSAAERAGAAARPARVAQPVPERRAAIPVRPGVSARVSAELAAIEPPERIALGSVTAPLPTHARPSRRPPTVELPMLDAPEPAVLAAPAPARVRASRPAPVAAPDRVLPSILSVIDRRHAPVGAASIAAELPAPRIISPSVTAPAAAPVRPAVEAVPEMVVPEGLFATEPVALPEVTIELDPAVPEAIAPEVSVPTERMVMSEASFAPEPPAALPAAAPAAPAARSIDRELHLDSPAAVTVRPRQRRSASFSDVDAAFFAAGEQMERGEVGSFDDESEPVPSLKRPPLWRRITGRHRVG